MNIGLSVRKTRLPAKSAEKQLRNQFSVSTLKASVFLVAVGWHFVPKVISAFASA